MSTTQPIVPIAIAKAIADKDYKSLSAELTPGVHHVDCVIHLKGTLKKGEPFESAVAAAIDPWSLLHRALSKLNQTTIDSLVEEALKATESEVEEVKAKAKKAIERLVAATTRTMPGRITTQVTWSVVS